MEKIYREKYLKKQIVKSFLTPQKDLKKVRKIGLQKTMVKVLQWC